MSKTTKKDKKNDQNSALQKDYQNQKRQLLDCQFSIKKLQQRLYDIAEENVRLRKNIDDSAQKFNDNIEELSIKNMANQKRLLSLSNEKTKLQIENEQKQNKIKILQRNIFDEQQSHLKDVEQSRKNLHFEQAKYESQLSEYKLYMNERDQLDQERQDLRERIEIEKANKLREIADKQRQKIQATDKIKDQMNHKIKDMQKNLVSIKRQQLQTTTRLTMLQNHQLTSELEYQSKQTEKLIFKNEELEQKVTSLKQQLEIHKEVEEQLAKRSHFSKGVIRKLNLKINELEQEVDKLKNQLCLPTHIQATSDSGQKYQDHSFQKSSMNQANLDLSNPSNKKLISSLEQQLEKSEKKYVELLTHYEGLKKERESLENKLTTVDKKANQIFRILHKYYNEVLLKNRSGDQNPPTEQEDQQLPKENYVPYEFNLQHLRDVPVQSWKIEDLTLTVQILLNIIQPYMIRSNLIVPSVRKNIILSDGITHRRSDSSFKSLSKLSTERKQGYQVQSKADSTQVNLLSKIVGNSLREWGQSVKINKMCLKRKYKVAQSFRN